MRALRLPRFLGRRLASDLAARPLPRLRVAAYVPTSGAQQPAASSAPGADAPPRRATFADVDEVLTLDGLGAAGGDGFTLPGRSSRRTFSLPTPNEGRAMRRSWQRRAA